MHCYFLSEIHENEAYTAGVVNKHIEHFLMNKGYKRISFRFIKYNNLFVKFFRLLQVFYLLVVIPKNSLVLFHFPVIPRAFQLLQRLFTHKNIVTVALIHDLDGLRFGKEKVFEKEIRLLKMFTHVIAHNQSMANMLVNHHISKEKIEILWLFDYEVENKQFQQRTFKYNIALAANLEKAVYTKLLNDWQLQYTFVSLFIYGVANKTIQLQNRSIQYMGVVEPEKLPNIIQGSFGMVWDGDSLEECTGPVGTYLQFNTPHKLSLYLSAGLPVIVWAKSAMANWVTKNNVGFAVQSWDEAAIKMKNTDSKIYNIWQSNARKIGEKLRKGAFINQVLIKIENKYSC